MKQFFKFLLASCLGTILAFGALFFLMFAIGSAFSSRDVSVGKDAVLMLELDALIPEKTDNVEQDPFDFEAKKAIGVHHIEDLIYKARTDKNIKGIVYKAGFATSGGVVTHSIIREAIESFKDSTDKFVYSYGDFFTNNNYLIASAADSIFVNPNGMLDINGYGAMIPFFKEMLDKIGIKMNVFYAGNFKSATEPFRRTDMSPENRQQTREYLQDNFDLYVDEVCRSRNIEEEDFIKIVNELAFNNVDRAVDLGLIDGKIYWYEFEELLRERLGLSVGKKINYVDLQEYESKSYISKGKSSNKIAVIYAEGEIMYDNDQRGIVSEVKYHKIFDKIKKNDDIKAVVLRVNSPGGSAFSSNIIWKEIEELKARGLPVIASFGDYAASGGYYISAGADTIVAHPKTLTGSIGVFSLLPNMSELFNDKLGIQFDTVKISPNALAISPFYDLNQNESSSLQSWTDELYNQFLSIVAEGRGMTVEDVHAVAQGRVWTGQKAVEKGLVDLLGDLDDAIEIAADKADISDDFRIVSYPYIKKEPWEQLLEDLSKMEEVKTRMPSVEDQLLKKFKEVHAVVKYREPMARLPFVVQ